MAWDDDRNSAVLIVLCELWPVNNAFSALILLAGHPASEKLHFPAVSISVHEDLCRTAANQLNLDDLCQECVMWLS